MRKQPDRVHCIGQTKQELDKVADNTVETGNTNYIFGQWHKLHVSYFNLVCLDYFLGPVMPMRSDFLRTLFKVIFCACPKSNQEEFRLSVVFSFAFTVHRYVSAIKLT